MVAQIFNIPFLVQIILFLVVSLITISLGYPWVKKRINMDIKRTPLMEESYIGRVMIADKEITDRGEIKVDGIYWSVKNLSSNIKKDEKFKIIRIDGIKLVIKKEGDI